MCYNHAPARTRTRRTPQSGGVLRESPVRGGDRSVLNSSTFNRSGLNVLVLSLYVEIMTSHTPHTPPLHILLTPYILLYIYSLLSLGFPPLKLQVLVFLANVSDQYGGHHPGYTRQGLHLMPFENNVFCVCSVLSHPSHASAAGGCAPGVCASRGAQLRLSVTRLPSEAFSGSHR